MTSGEINYKGHIPTMKLLGYAHGIIPSDISPDMFGNVVWLAKKINLK